jgi:4-amino-4-deoxy-L-arabinose transferase-like glycosyltransferase
VFGFGGREKVKPFLLSISLPHIGATFQPSAVREEQQDEVVTIKVRKAPIKKKNTEGSPGLVFFCSLLIPFLFPPFTFFSTLFIAAHEGNDAHAASRLRVLISLSFSVIMVFSC